jgi:hypothetical protein
MVFAQVFRRLIFATSLLCTAPLFAQEARPQPIPPMEEASSHRPAPQVVYADGKLQITAHHVELGDILDAIRVHTGAVISAPLTVTTQPVSIKVGPATLLDVMTDLLETAECNYIVVGSAAHPATLRISVFPKPAEPEVVDFVADATTTPKNAGNTPDSSIVTVPEPTNDAELGSVAATPKQAETESGEGPKQAAPNKQAGDAKTAEKETENPNPDGVGSNQEQQITAAPKK